MKAGRGPKVSVCIPVYNGSLYIGQCIESVLAQTLEDFQLIVCDNCSTDNTEEIVRSFPDERIKHIRNAENLGLVGNANRCLHLAEGEYVCILHHDDMMMPNNLEYKVELLEEYPNVGFVHSNLWLIDPKGKIVSANIWEEDSRRNYIENGIKVFSRYVLKMPYGASIFIGAVVARKSCYQEVGGFCKELPHCNDSEMWMRMLLRYDIACLGTPLIKYRVHPTSASNNFGDWTSAGYFQEHYEAVSMIFKNHCGEIPDCRQMKEKVSLAFAQQALHLAGVHMESGDFASSRALLIKAPNINRLILRKINYWKSAVKNMAGPKAVRFYQQLKKRDMPDRSIKP